MARCICVSGAVAFQILSGGFIVHEIMSKTENDRALLFARRFFLRMIWPGCLSTETGNNQKAENQYLLFSDMKIC